MPVIIQKTGTRAVIVDDKVTIVSGAPSAAKTVTVSRRDTAITVDKGIETVIIPDRSAVESVTKQTRTVSVSTTGPRGPRGADGSGQIPPINFAWGDASPIAVYTPAEDVWVDDIQIVITAVFDGVGAQIALGTAGSPELYMPFVYSAANRLGTYEASPDLVLAAGTDVILTIVPGAGASTGAGSLLLSFTSL